MITPIFIFGECFIHFNKQKGLLLGHCISILLAIYGQTAYTATIALLTIMATMFLYDKEFSMTNIKNLLVSHNRQEKQLNINSRINCTVENNDSKIMLEKLLGKLKKIKKESILKQIVSKSQQTNHNDDDLICLKKEMNDLTHEDINF